MTNVFIIFSLYLYLNLSHTRDFIYEVTFVWLSTIQNIITFQWPRY